MVSLKFPGGFETHGASNPLITTGEHPDSTGCIGIHTGTGPDELGTLNRLLSLEEDHNTLLVLPSDIISNLLSIVGGP